MYLGREVHGFLYMDLSMDKPCTTFFIHDFCTWISVDPVYNALHPKKRFNAFLDTISGRNSVNLVKTALVPGTCTKIHG